MEKEEEEKEKVEAGENMIKAQNGKENCREEQKMLKTGNLLTMEVVIMLVLVRK